MGQLLWRSQGCQTRRPQRLRPSTRCGATCQRAAAAVLQRPMLHCAHHKPSRGISQAPWHFPLLHPHPGMKHFWKLKSVSHCKRFQTIASKPSKLVLACAQDSPDWARRPATSGNLPPLKSPSEYTCTKTKARVHGCQHRGEFHMVQLCCMGVPMLQHDFSAC